MKKPVRILIVEDKPEDAHLAEREIRRIVGDCDFQITETREGFIQAIETFQPDVILSDFVLPQFDGMEALKLSLHYAPSTPFIIWTGSLSEDVAVDCVKAGANNYILKDNFKRLAPAVLHALEERELLAARKQAEQKYRTIFENSMEGIFQSSPQGRYLSLNPAMARLYGYDSPKEMMESIQDIATQIYVEPEKRSEFIGLLGLYNDIENFEARNYRKDKSVFWTSTSARAVRNESEDILYFEGFVQDITQRKEAEEALQNKERRFRSLIENGLDDISLLAADGTLLWESPSTIRNLGYAPDEFVGRNIFELMHPEDFEPTQQTYAKLLKVPGHRQRGIFRLRRADGTWRWMEAVGTNMLHDPAVRAIVINYHDITEKKQAEIELQQRNADLALVNTLNEVINRGEALDVVMDLLREELKCIFSSEYTNIYLLTPDRQSIRLHHYSIPPEIARKIEKVIGRVLPKIEIPVQEDGLFQSVLRSGRGMVTSDPKVLQTWIGEFAETASLPPLAKAAIRKLLPQIYKILDIKSTILVPLISDGKPLGVINVSGPVIFTEQDLSRIENICGQLTIALHRKQIEEALRESQTRYQNLVETSHDLIWSVDAEARFTFVNRASVEIYGYEPEELIGRSFFDLLDPEHHQASLKVFKETIAKVDEVKEFETYVRHRDGRQIILSSNSMVLRDKHGAITGVTGSSHDVTIRKRVEDVLKGERNLLRTLIDNIPDRIYAMDMQGRKTLSNIADWQASGGKTMEDVIGKTDFELYPGGLAEEFWKLDQTVLHSGQPVINHEEPGLDAEGNYVSILTSKIPLRDDDGKVVGLVGIGRDITERKQTEQRLRRNEDRYRLATKATNDVIWEWDPKTHRLLWSENARYVFGYQEEEIGPDERWWDDRIHPEDRTRVITKLDALLVGKGSNWLEEYRFLLEDGSYAYISDRAYIERDEEGAPIRMIGAMSNITERKQAEQRINDLLAFNEKILNHSPIGILTYKLTGECVFANQNAASMLGAQADQLREQNFHSIQSWKISGLYDLVNKAIRSQAPLTADIHLISTFGKEVWMTVHCVTFKSKDEDHLLLSMTDITERKQAEIERQALLEIMQGLANTKDLQELLTLVHHSIAKVVYAENFFVVLHQETTGLFEEIYSVDQYDPPAAPSRLENSITSYVFRSGEPLLLTQDSFAELEARGEVRLVGTDSASWLGVPLKTAGRTIGVMAVQDYENHNRYSEREKDFLTSIATQVGLVIDHKRAEESLQQSEALYRRAIEVAGAVPYYQTYYDEGKLINYKFIGEGIRQITGYGPEEFSAALWDSLVEEINLVDDLAGYPLEEAIHRVRMGKNSIWKCEHRLQARDGSIHWVFEAAVELRDENGISYGSIGTYQDITERKRAEQALRESEERFSSAFEYAAIGMALLTPEGRWFRVNRALCDLTGYSEAELLERTFQDISYAEDLEADLSHVNKLLKGEINSYQMEKRYFHKLGHVIWILLSVSLLRDHQGNPLYFISQIQDITERKRAEEAIRRGAKETSALLETSLALTNLDLEATLQTIGNSASSLFLADGCRIFLLEPEGETMHCVLALGENTDAFLNLRIKLGQGVTGAVAASGKAEIVNEMQDDPRALQVPNTEEEREAIMFAPLKERDRTIGILSIRRLGGNKPFRQSELELLEAFASMAASAVSKARLFDETQHRLADLHASEERFRQLAENIQEVFWMTDAETKKELYMSPAVETIWGRSVQSLMYEPNAFITSVYSEDRPVVMNALEREKNGEKMQLEYRIVRPDGSLRWIWDRAFPIFDDSGKVTRIAGISADITERRESELALVKSQNRYRELFDSSPISIWEEDFSLVKKQLDTLLQNGVTDLRDYFSNHPGFVRELAALVRIIDVNKASMELYGVSRKEDLPSNLGDLFDSTSIKHFEAEVLELMGPLKRFSWEGTEITPAGKQIEMLVNGSIPQGYEEDWSKVIVSIIDVTERRRTEQELRKLSRAVEQSGSSILITDTFGHIEYVNPKFTQITGYSYEEAIGQKPSILKSGFTSDEEYKQLWNTISNGGEWHGELLNQKKDGTLYWESVTISPILNDRKEITHYVGVKEDITERKQSELETRRHISELEAVYENGLSVGRLLEPGEIGNRVIETFARYLPWHHVTIRLRKEGTDDLELVSFNLPSLKEEERSNAEQHFIARINKVGQGLSGWVIQTGMPLRTGNVHRHPQYIDTHAGIQSGLYMPLKVGERVIGVITVESEVPDAFTEQDQRLLATLANQTAIAFENARLYEVMQKELLERKRVEDALRVSESHYRALADSITDILFEMDQDLRYTHWNKASEMLTGFPASEAIGRSMEDILGRTGEQARIKMIYEEVLRSQQPRTFETTLVFRGENRSFETTAYPSLRGVSVVAKDITDRKRTEIIMQKRFELMEFSARHSLNELMLRTVDEVSELTGSTIGFFHFMDEDQIHLGMQTWSTNALHLFQVPVEHGSHLPLDQAGVWAEAVRQRRPLVQNYYEVLANRKGIPEGHVPIVREIVIPIIRNERIMAVMGIANKFQEYTSHDLETAVRLADYAWDITERKQMEVALQLERNQLVQRVEERTVDLSRANSNLARALRVKDEFLANMSHELRTPLNAILGLSESLGEQIAGPLNEKQQKYISTISESGHHLLSLINDILDLAKIDAGQITLDINKVDLHSVCQASLRMVKQLAQKKNQEVSLEIDPGLGLMWADERRLKQMIVNLLGNAVKFTPENGKLGLEVHGDEEANQIAITVWDNGIGVQQNDLARLFQPFVQLDSGLAREATGTGLGLALVAQMARLHGGSVNAVSEPGKGSRFAIILPWEPALAMDSAARMKITGKFRTIQLDAENKPTILLVEDTKEVVMMLKDYLELAGYRVFTAQDGVDGIVQARHVKPDLILMDVQMPQMDGFETTRKLRSDPNFRYTPIIALTALAMPHDRERCLEAGMDEYISKPVNLKALVKIIQSCLFEQGTRAR